MRISNHAAQRTAAAVAVAALLIPAAAASAKQGDLVQKSGLNACISNDGRSGVCSIAGELSHPEGIVISPDGRNAYAASFSSAALSIFDRNPSTGVLTPKAGTKACIAASDVGGLCTVGNAAFGGLNSVVVSPDGKNVYATAADPGSLLVFDRNTSNGELTLKAGTAACFGDSDFSGACTAARGLAGAGGWYNATALKVSPDGKNVYASGYADSGLAIFDRNTSTGALTQKAGLKGCISRDGKSNGVEGQCTPGTAMDGFDSIVIPSDGKNLYGPSWDTDAIVAFTRNTTNGELTQLAGKNACLSSLAGNSGACNLAKGLGQGNSVTVSPDGKHIYVAAGKTPGSIGVFTRNKSTGVLTQATSAGFCMAGEATGELDGCSQFSLLNTAPLDGLYDVVVSKDGKNVYAVSSGGGALLTFARNQQTGGLSVPTGGVKPCVAGGTHGGACDEGKAFDSMQSLFLSPDGKHLYAASTNANAIVAFDRTRASSSYKVKSVGKALRRNRLVVSAKVEVPGDGRVSLIVKDGRKRVCSAAVTVGGAGTVSISCTAGGSIRNKMKRGNLNLAVETTFTPTGQEPAGKSHKVKVKKSR